MFDFSRKLKCLRIEKNLTQKELANLLNVSQNAIYNWENGKRQPKIEQIQKIANVLEVQINELLGWSEIETVINDELYRLDQMTMAYIKVLESEGYRIDLGNENVHINTKNEAYTVTRKDFMSMIHYCSTDINNNIEKLLRNYT